MTKGFVYLVGAGPGDPDLLTVKARRLLECAKVVAHDALIASPILSVIHPEAELLPVGYRGYGSSKHPYRLHPDVIKRAQDGQIVIRLKSGDPFIFGRGGEECEELNEVGIPFEVVPGISSALGAAAYAGIPLTHRKYASDVIFASGHDVLGGSPSLSDWNSLAQGKGTLVLFMAVRKLEANLERLITMGREPSTPAAYISNATQASQKVVSGTLETLPSLLDDIERELPALIIVGEAVRLHKEVSWFVSKAMEQEI